MRAILLLILALALMIADRQNSAFHRFRDSISAIVTPLQYAVDAPIKIVNDVIVNFTTQHSLIEDNTQLHAQLLLLQAKLQKLSAIESENQELTALLQSSLQAQEQMTIAQILAIAIDPLIQQIVIDKGDKDKIFIGQPVLDASGVMGQVVQVGVLTSRVMLLTDTESSIPVQVRRNGIRAIAVGLGSSGLLKLVHVINTADIKEGDMLITSGLAQRYPFGYPVGKVIAVKNDTGDQFADILVQPSAHLDRSRLVLLVWHKKTQIDPEIKKVLIARPMVKPNIRNYRKKGKKS